jgi:hypothetical protein
VTTAELGIRVGARSVPMNCVVGVEGRGVRAMLLYEELARARMREAEEQARHRRLVCRLVAGRRWARLARYASVRAERASARL